MRGAQGSETLGDLGGPAGGYRALLYASELSVGFARRAGQRDPGRPGRAARRVPRAAVRLCGHALGGAAVRLRGRAAPAPARAHGCALGLGLGLGSYAAMHWAVLLSGCAAAPHLHPLVLMGAL